MAALEHIDAADRAAPTRIRSDPIARDLVLTLDRRARRRERELDSLRNRFGIGRVVHGGEQRATRTRQHRAGYPMVVRVAGGPLARPTHGEARAGEMVSGHYRAVAVSR